MIISCFCWRRILTWYCFQIAEILAVYIYEKLYKTEIEKSDDCIKWIMSKLKDIYRYSKVKSNGVFNVILGNYIIANIGSVEKLW
jgi:hypothetical protein